MNKLLLALLPLTLLTACGGSSSSDKPSIIQHCSDANTYTKWRELGSPSYKYTLLTNDCNNLYSYMVSGDNTGNVFQRAVYKFGDNKYTLFRYTAITVGIEEFVEYGYFNSYMITSGNAEYSKQIYKYDEGNSGVYRPVGGIEYVYSYSEHGNKLTNLAFNVTDYFNDSIQHATLVYNK